MNPAIVAVALAFQSTRPPLSHKPQGIQWLCDVTACIRALRSKMQGFDAEQFLTLTGYTDDQRRAWDIK